MVTSSWKSASEWTSACCPYLAQSGTNFRQRRIFKVFLEPSLRGCGENRHFRINRQRRRFLAKAELELSVRIAYLDCAQVLPVGENRIRHGETVRHTRLFDLPFDRELIPGAFDFVFRRIIRQTRRKDPLIEEPIELLARVLLRNAFEIPS